MVNTNTTKGVQAALGEGKGMKLRKEIRRKTEEVFSYGDHKIFSKQTCEQALVTGNHHRENPRGEQSIQKSRCR